MVLAKVGSLDGHLLHEWGFKVVRDIRNRLEWTGFRFLNEDFKQVISYPILILV